ncbi:MAG: type II toxin-antitoxin system HicB family antitoxin [Candidatus Lokiarchaeota archaeon]|nr:type II toxin-antitoxin system HicB family antitoxin [Candidatus Lokiarchaeota archaeon]
MKETLTTVYEKSPYGYIGYVEELPGANTQSNALEETKENLKETILLIIEANRQLSKERATGKDILIKEHSSVLL